jgi:hypothetical protein
MMEPGSAPAHQIYTGRDGNVRGRSSPTTSPARLTVPPGPWQDRREMPDESAAQWQWAARVSDPVLRDIELGAE